MHRITPCSQKVMLRFRRWSRKEYAAFVSLHRHVTIGQVGRGIADASLGKQKTAVCEGMWCLLVSQREEVPALLLDKINKITITGRGVSVSG